MTAASVETDERKKIEDERTNFGESILSMIYLQAVDLLDCSSTDEDDYYTKKNMKS